jgi:hypothetical protein
MAIAATLLASCATQAPSSYPRATADRLAAYAKATPCCDDPSGFSFAELPKQGYAHAVVDAASPVFDFQSGLSPFAAFELLDDTFIVVHMTGLESLRLEPSLATAGGESGLAVSIGIDPVEQEGKYLVVFTPATLLGQPPPPDREGDMLSLSSLAYMERRGEAALPASPYGLIRITVAPEVAVAEAAPPD